MTFFKHGFVFGSFFLMSLLAIKSAHAKVEDRVINAYQINTKADTLLQKYKTANDEKAAAHYAFQLGEYYWFQRQIKEAEKWFMTSLEKEAKPDNKNDVVNTLILLANLNHHKGDFENAEDYANLAFEKISLVDNKRLLGNIFEIKGRISHSLGKSEASFNYFLKADSVNMQYPDPQIRKLSVYVKLIIADIFNGQGQMDKSLDYLNRALQTAQKYNDSTQIHLCLMAKARWNIAVGKLTKAKSIYYQILENKKSNSANLYTYQGLGEILYKEKNYGQAVQYFTKVVDMAKKTNELYMLDVFYHDVAKTYYAKNDLVKSNIYLDSCINHKGSNLSNKLMAYQLKSQILETQKDYKGAFEAVKIKNHIQDSLNRQNLAVLTNQLDAAHRTKEKDSKIRLLEYEKMAAEAINSKNNIIKYLLFFIIIILALVFYMIYHQMKKKKIIEQQLAIQEEQNRISADLHDDIGSTLSSISVYSELASKYYASSPEKSKEMVQKIAIHSSELMTRIGDIIWSLKPNAEGHFNLTNKIKELTSELLYSKNIHCKIDIIHNLEDLIHEPKSRKNLLLIIKEALHNIAKHSGADHVHINMTEDKTNLILCIADNGKGIKKENSKTGNGLGNMKNRAADLGGTCDIISDFDQGTKVVCTLPLPKHGYIMQSKK
jgi:signal transduction histidine kinase